MNATSRDRVATPVEFAALMAALEIEDALPYALAAYAMARRAQIQRLRWAEVDLRLGAIEWGVDEMCDRSRQRCAACCPASWPGITAGGGSFGAALSY